MSKTDEKNQRHDRILSSLDELGFLTTEQIRQVHSLGSTRNTTRIMHDLHDYVNVFRDVENVYYLNKKGADRVGSSTVRDKTMQYRHFLMRNEMYLHYRCPSSWRVEVPIQGGIINIIPDVLFKKQGKFAFIEIDHTQKMNINIQKLNRYKELKDTGLFQQKYEYFPDLIWFTTTEVRRKKLTKYCNDRGLKSYIYTKEDLR